MSDERAKQAARPQLVHEARRMIRCMYEKWQKDPDADDFSDTFPIWQRHAINAVLDLESAESKLARLAEENARLKAEADELREDVKLARSYHPSLCGVEGHSAENCFSDDGGKHIVCLRCELVSAESTIRELKQALEALMAAADYGQDWMPDEKKALDSASELARAALESLAQKEPV